MKRKGVLTCGPSIEIVKFPYVVVKAAGEKVESSVLGEAVFITLPFSPTSFILLSCKLVATESFLYVVLKMGAPVSYGDHGPKGTMDRYRTNIFVLVF